MKVESWGRAAMKLCRSFSISGPRPKSHPVQVLGERKDSEEVPLWAETLRS